jgi:protease IV
MKFSTILLLVLFSSNIIFAQEKTPQKLSFLGYDELSNFLPTSPGAYKFGLYGFSNPAMMSYFQGPSDLTFAYNKSDSNGNDRTQWGLFSASKYSSSGVISQDYRGEAVYDYRYNLAFGDRTFSLGIGYGFVGGAKSMYGRQNSMSWGFLYRPNTYLSVSGSQIYAINSDGLSRQTNESVAEIAVRPFGTYPLTLFADAAMKNWDYADFDLNGSWSTGVSWEFLSGMRVHARYFESERISIGIDISGGDYGLAFMNTSQKAQSENESDTKGNTIFLRFGAEDRTITEDIDIVKYYVKVNLSGAIKYQRNMWFDDSRTLLETLEMLETAKNNSNVKGLVINTVGMRANMEFKWEIRNKLQELRDAGKEIIIFIERVGINDYHFASVANKIIIDELGMVMLPGYSFGRSYYKNMLDKFNIGFEELRFFKYKSAVESFARSDHSDGHREQMQSLADSWYETARSEISLSRNITQDKFDGIVNDKLFYTPDEAKDLGLIDTTGRWVYVDDIISSWSDDLTFVVPEKFLSKEEKPFDDHWGSDDNHIAVIYARGVCAMESGIKARTLVNDIKAAVENDKIKAIVLRVDSPGGDALASEYIAKVVRDNKGKKPIIVSQGMLAASGGYWLSMDADEIVASPVTITGSIGVIAAWIYDKGLASDMGITTDQVKRGKYSDLGNSFSLPLIGIGLPTRNLTEEEHTMYGNMIKKHYTEFTGLVAQGRGMDTSAVLEVAQGRVWSGRDGKEKGLVDKIGGLDYAIQLAKQKANIDHDAEITILEYPKPELFDLSSLLSGMTGVNIDAETHYINTFKFNVANAGRPMVMMPTEFWDYKYFTE